MVITNEQIARSGFTLTELLITIGITLILAVAAFPIYGSLQVGAQLDAASVDIVQIMRTAQARSIARTNGSRHGVYFDIIAGSDRVVLYQGNSYAARDSSYDRPLVLDSALSLSSNFSSEDINFLRGSGVPTATGTVTVAHEATGNRVIDINEVGRIDLQ